MQTPPQNLCNSDWVCAYIKRFMSRELQATCREAVELGMHCFLVIGVGIVQDLVLKPLQFIGRRKSPDKVLTEAVLTAVHLSKLLKPMLEQLEQQQAAQAPAAAALLQPNASAAAAGMDDTAAAACAAGQAAGPSTSSGLQQCEAAAAADMHDMKHSSSSSRM